MDINCFVCKEMNESGEFTEEEIQLYHENELEYLSFNKKQRNILDEIFEEENSED